MAGLTSVKIQDNIKKHRQASWLELFFDLGIIISVASVTHYLINHISIVGLCVYTAIFLPIWWIWAQYTWYSSLFDNDDKLFRVLVLTAMFGNLILAAGIHHVFNGHVTHFVLAYIGLHVLLIMGMIRVFIDLFEYRSYALWNIIGLFIGIFCWGFSLLFHGSMQYMFWGIGLFFQILIPIFAWFSVSYYIKFHYHHIAERHGLFIIIVLAESLIALASGYEHHPGIFPLITALAGFIIIASIWWNYFDWDHERVKLLSTSNVFVFTYGHFFIFAFIGIFAAGLNILLNLSHPEGSSLGNFGNLFIAVTPALYLIAFTLMNLFQNFQMCKILVLKRFVFSIILFIVWYFGKQVSAIWFSSVVALLMITFVTYETILTRRFKT